MRRYRICGVSKSIVKRNSKNWMYDWMYARPYGWWMFYYPVNSTNIVDSQVQNAEQQSINTGTMIGNTQTQTATQIQ